MNDEYSSFTFILDSVTISALLPYEVIPGHWVRKAEPNEVERIKKEIETHGCRFPYYELSPDGAPTPGGGLTYPHLPEAEWRYYVISFRGSNDKIRDIEYSASLLEDDLTLGLTFIRVPGLSAGGVMSQMAQVGAFFADHVGMPTVKCIGNSELAQIGGNYQLITSFDKEHYPNVSRAVSDFFETNMITNRSLVKVLSYFAIIESLLTHPPDPADTIGSLTHQIATKMSLLTKRFERTVSFSSFFPKLADPEKAWKKLYGYRGTIAHGGRPDFGGKFLPLVNTDAVRLFLKKNVKLLLLYALKEPEFLADLQKC